ncbi:6-bladed beta-propeller [Bacteroides bouchesdurhonensis]|uniref:6-bladed beta-propeller n=1 Tax=Bacteroides bouchesdurhonensis TaxID=1841855 RepID=UPI0011DD3AB6|nr:6-bladed beta-propeller [Bacteroides bouchesdurhonensis]
MKTYYIIILFTSLFISCHSNSPNDLSPEIPVIDIAKAWDNNNKKVINASELFSNVEYIPLETNDKYLIDKIPHYYITDKFILIGGFLFNKKGDFVVKLGKIGQGPGEFISAKDELFNEDRKEFYALDNYTNYIHVYDINNHYLRSIPVPTFRNNFFLIDKDQLLITNRRGLFSITPESCEYSYIIIGVEKGDTLYKHTSISLSELKEIKHISGVPFDAFWTYNDTMSYYDGIRDTIYALKKGRIDYPRYIVDFGKYKDLKKIKNTLPADYKMGMYMKIITIHEYKNYLKLNITYNMEHKTIVYNKTNKSTFVLDNIQKDIDGICGEGSYIWPYDLNKDQINMITSKSGKKIREEDNPIIIIKKER